MAKKKSTKKSIEDKNQEDLLIDMSNAAVKKMLKAAKAEGFVNYKDINKQEWIYILFQIIYTLSVIQYHYPSFRHNDLSSGNIDEDHLDGLPVTILTGFL